MSLTKTHGRTTIHTTAVATSVFAVAAANVAANILAQRQRRRRREGEGRDDGAVRRKANPGWVILATVVDAPSLVSSSLLLLSPLPFLSPSLFGVGVH